MIHLLMKHKDYNSDCNIYANNIMSIDVNLLYIKTYCSIHILVSAFDIIKNNENLSGIGQIDLLQSVNTNITKLSSRLVLPT